MGTSKFVSRENENLIRAPKVRFKKTERHLVKKQIHEVDDYEDLDDTFDRFEKVRKGWCIVSMLVTVLIVLLTIAVCGLVACGFTIRGFLVQANDFNRQYKRRKLTGVQVEEIRRRVEVAGLSGITRREVLDLIYILRAIQIGDYSDKDPFVPADPYEGIDEEQEEVTIIPTVRR